MRVPLHIVEARRNKLAELIEQHRYLPLGDLCRKLGVSEATARRDLNALAKKNKLKRTHGGALAELDDRFPSFNERQSEGAKGKHQIARAALRLIQPGGVYFFDTGTTVFALAKAFRENPVSPVSIVTSNLPVGEILAGIPDVQVFQLAGQILGRQSVILGEAACKSLSFWNYDIAFLSAEAADNDGVWNTLEPIIRQQHVAIQQSTHVVFCLDARKLGVRGPFFLKGWSGRDFLLTDAPPAKLASAGIPVHAVQCLHASSSSFPNLLKDPSSPLPVHYL